MCQPINDELYWCYLPTSLLRRKQWVWDHEATGLAAESRCALAHTARVVTSTSSLASSCAFHPSLSQKWFESVTAPETRQMFNKYQRMRLTVVIAVLSGLSNMLQSTTSLPYHPGVAFFPPFHPSLIFVTTEWGDEDSCSHIIDVVTQSSCPCLTWYD